MCKNTPNYHKNGTQRRIMNLVLTLTSFAHKIDMCHVRWFIAITVATFCYEKYAEVARTTQKWRLRVHYVSDFYQLHTNSLPGP